MAEPMQIHSSRFCKLTLVEKERCKIEGLCALLWKKEHDLSNCYHKPSASKPHKFWNTFANTEIGHKDNDQENNNVQSQ